MSLHKRAHATRGFGLLEVFLAKKRANTANKLIKGKLKKGRVLDIGCGSFPYFLVSTDFKEKHGIDGHIDRAGFKLKDVTLKKMNVEKDKIPYKTNYFDVVVMLAVFEHIHPEKLTSVLSEVKRVLKKNGTLILTTPAPWAVPVLWLFSRVGLISKLEIDDHKPLSSPKKIREFLKRGGFEKRKIRQGFFESGFNIWVTAKK